MSAESAHSGDPSPHADSDAVARPGDARFAPVDIFVTPVTGGYEIRYDQGDGLTLSEYKRLLTAIAQLRHSLRGAGFITIPRHLKACIKLARKTGFKFRGNSINGDRYMLPDPQEARCFR